MYNMCMYMCMYNMYMRFKMSPNLNLGQGIYVLV